MVIGFGQTSYSVRTTENAIVVRVLVLSGELSRAVGVTISTADDSATGELKTQRLLELSCVNKTCCTKSTLYIIQ